MSIYCVVAQEASLDGQLLELDLLNGAIVSESSLRSAKTRLSVDSAGQYLGLSDGITFRLMDTRGNIPCRPQDTPTRPPTHPMLTQHEEPCCCKPKSPNDSPHPTYQTPEPADKPPGNPCDPGQSGTPTPGGGRVIGDGSGVNYYPPGGSRTHNPCRAHLFFETYYLEAAATYFIAADREAKNIAVLDATDLSIFQQFQSREGNVLLSHPAQPLMIVYSRRDKSWEIKRFDTIDRIGLDAVPNNLDPDLLMDVMTFTGSPFPGGLKGTRAKTTGRIKVLVIPVLDPGQFFNDADLPKMKKYLQRVAYNNVELFYRENSFGLLEYIDFDIHGVDVGTGGPARLPKPISEYYNPLYIGAHVDLVKSGMTFPAHIIFDGRERMTLNVHPQNGGRPASVLNLKFSALLAAKTHANFPVQIRFDGTETASISMVRPNGAATMLNLTFPAKSLDIETNNIAAKLAELEGYLDGIFAKAEAMAGIAGRLFTRPSIRRVAQDSSNLGLLVTTLSHTATTGARLDIISMSYSSVNDPFGFRSAFTGRIPVDTGAGTEKLRNYLDFISVLAQEDAGSNYSQRKLAADPVVNADPGTGKLTSTFFISDEDGGPGATISISNIVEMGGLFDTSNAVANTPVTSGRSNTPKEGEPGFDGMISDVFTQLVERQATPGQHVNQKDKIMAVFNAYQAVIIGVVNPALAKPEDDSFVRPDEMWAAGPSSMRADMRSIERPRTAVYRPAPKDIQFFSNWNLGFFTVPPEFLVYCHELGHALGFGDLYKREAGYREDVIYMDKWAMMHNHNAGSHHCGYHKRQAGWIPDSRVATMERPLEDQTLTREFLLVPVEQWPYDDGIIKGAQLTFGKDLPVVQLVELDLGGNADVYVQIEARDTGLLFSKTLPNDPAVLITNCTVWWDERRYAFNDKYRAPVHLLHNPAGMTRKDDSFDLARGAAFPAKGIVVKIIDRQTVRGQAVFHISVERKHSREFIDLYFSSSDPYYRNPDLYIDWTGNNSLDGKSSDLDPKRHLILPNGSPIDQGETIYVPNSGEELHWMVARLRNIGNTKAVQVKLNFSICDPPGGGDHGNFKVKSTQILDEVAPTGLNNPLSVPAPWAVQAGFTGHTCIMVEIADYKIPIDTTGAALATDDVWQANNWAQKNVDRIEPKSSSPYEPIEFDFSVNNNGKWPEYAYLEPEGLPYGMQLTVYPKRRKISAGETAIFRCKLELDDKLIDASCRGDHDFRIICWRVDEEASTRWGGVEYQVRPRKRSKTALSGSWDARELEIRGHVSPDPGAGTVRIRLAYTDQHARWVTADLQPGGTFVYKEKPPIVHGQVLTVALFEGNKYWSSSRSPEVKILPPPVIA